MADPGHRGSSTESIGIIVTMMMMIVFCSLYIRLLFTPEENTFKHIFFRMTYSPIRHST